MFICGHCNNKVRFEAGISDYIKCTCGKVNFVSNTGKDPKNLKKKKKKSGFKKFLKSVFGKKKKDKKNENNL